MTPALIGNIIVYTMRFLSIDLNSSEAMRNIQLSVQFWTRSSSVQCGDQRKGLIEKVYTNPYTSSATILF